MRRRFFLIENAIAGTGPGGLVARVVDLLERAGASVERCRGVSASEAEQHAITAAHGGDFDALIAAGGDGTIRHAARAVAGTNIPLGVIPLGTANVLAHEIGLVRTARELAHVLQAGSAETIEAPLANGELFLLMAGAGFDGRVIEALSHAVKGRIGKLAYAGPILRALTRPADSLEVSIDGKLHRTSWVVITNARHYGGRFVIAPSTSVHEKGLRAVLFDAPSRSELVKSLLALAMGQLGTCRHVSVHTCAHVEVRSEMRVPVQVDGDAFGATPLVVEARGGPRVSLIMPAQDVSSAG
jgi:diacylglycerol kinase family enzyme